MPAPIDRTNLNALVDDDGSGLVGSFWDKATIGSVLMDQIDEALTDVKACTLTGTQNDYALGAVGAAVLRCANASALTFTGFANGAAGRSVLVKNIGTSTVKFAHETTSTAANRFTCLSTNGQILGAGGSALALYDATTSRWTIELIDPGAPIAVAFAAGNFTGSGAMTWTVAVGDQLTFSYQQRGKTLKVWFTIATSTVGGTLSNTLQIAIPASFAVAAEVHVSASVFDNNVGVASIARVRVSQTNIEILRYDAGNFSASTDLTFARGCIEFEVN